MSGLSASAIIIFNYAKKHANKDGYVDLQDYTDLPENILINACKELRRYGLISDVAFSSDSVEYIIL